MYKPFKKYRVEKRRLFYDNQDLISEQNVWKRTGIALNVREGELDLVLGRDVFPGGQEDLLFHVAVLTEENVDGHDAGEVEHVDVILNRNLDTSLKN